MFKASSLLLTLVLHVWICSSAPIREGLLSFEESPVEEDIPVIVKEPEPVFAGDPVHDDPSEDISWDPAPDVPLVAAPQDYLEEDTFSEEPVSSPAETTEDAVPGDYDVVDGAPEVLIPVTSLDDSEDVAPEDDSEEDTAIETAGDNTSPEERDLENPVPAEPIPIISDNAEEASEEHAAKDTSPKEPLLIVTDVETEVGEEPEEEESVMFIPAESETEEEEPTVKETAENSDPEDPDVMVPPHHAEQEPHEADQEDNVAIISPETEEKVEEEASPEEHLVPVPGDNTHREEESLSVAEEEEKLEEQGQGEPTGEQTAPGDPDVIVLVEPAEAEPSEEKPDEALAIMYTDIKEEEAPVEHVEEKTVVLEENVEVEPDTSEDPLPSTLEQDESAVLVHVELEPEEEGQDKTAGEDKAPEDPAVAVALIPVEEEGDEEAEVVPMPIVPVEIEEQDAAKDEEPLSSNPEEEEPVALVPLEPGAGEEGQEKTAAEESVAEEPGVIVPLIPAEEEPEVEDQDLDESIPILSPEEGDKETEMVPVPIVPVEIDEEDAANDEEPLPSTEEEEPIALVPLEPRVGEEGQEETATEEIMPEDPDVIVSLVPSEEESEVKEQTEAEAKAETDGESESDEGFPVPIVPAENAEQEISITEETLPVTPKEEEPVVVPAERDSEEEHQEAVTEEEIAPKEPAVIVLVEPTSEEPAFEDPIISVPLEDLEEVTSEDNTEEEDIQTETISEEDTDPQVNEAESDAEIIVTSISETIQTALDPDEEIQEAATEAHVAVISPVKVKEAKSVPVPRKGGSGTSMKTHNEAVKAAAVSVEEEPVALVSRGTVLGAAFFTLMALISLGFVWITVSKKLR